ncbi:AAA family ATPase [Candidatus Uhrbacteria bacterium]|nr:AAA family ATPase [Candidatus Uhrbacteria bacterium]
MSRIGTEYEVVFIDKNGMIVPTLASGKQPGIIEIRNLEAFSDRVCEGARFAASLIEMQGSARNPTRVVLKLERQIIAIDGKGLGTDFWIRPETLALIEADVYFGRAIRLVGPKGSGKTTFAQLLAKMFGVPFIKVDGTGIFKPKDLFGAESAEDGSTKWVPSDLMLFIETHRSSKHWPKAIVCLDEFSRMGHSMAPFHALFDHTGQYSFTTTDGTVVIDGLTGFIFILTDNPVGPGYIGNQSLDAAMSDRVEEHEFTYPPIEWEVPWLVSRTGITVDEATHIVQVAAEVRVLATAQMWEQGGPSPRRTLRAAEDVSIGKPMSLVVHARIIDRYPDGDAESPRRVIQQRLKSAELLDERVAVVSVVNVADVGAPAT